MTPHKANLRSYGAMIRECAIGPWEPLSKATGIADGLANRLARASAYSEARPAEAQDHLVGAFATWPVLCRVMAELEADYPEEAGRGAAQARRLVDALDRRDGVGDYA